MSDNLRDKTMRAIEALRLPNPVLARCPNTVRQSIADVIEELASQCDKYGLALMMIGQGCANPAGLARDTLAPRDREETR